MALKKHHKIIIGGASSLLILFIIVSSILTYTLFARQEINYIKLNNHLKEIQIDTQSKINELTSILTNTQKELKSLDTQLGSIDEEFELLKASAGEDFSGIIDSAIKSVVTIRTDLSQGTGFIIHEEGYIVTNSHIMQGATSAGIITYDDTMHNVNLIGENAAMDIALLKIDGNYEILELENSDNIQIGEKVIAIGNPLGLQFSVSEGIVSAINRPGLNNIEAYIQTDAALNPGNSGGPLINKQGKAIGINNFKIGGGESLGFALESNYIKDILNQISQQGLNMSLIG